MGCTAGDGAAERQPPLWNLFGNSPDGNAARIMEALREGADPNVRDGNGNTSVHYAAAYHLGVLRAVIAHGGRCGARNSFGTTPLHVAAAQGAFGTGPEGVRILADCSPDSLGVQDDRGNTPLHAFYEGAQSGLGSLIPNTSHSGGDNEGILKALLEGGADPNARNKARDTPMLAWLKGRGGSAAAWESQLRLLLKHDADPDTRDGKGTPAVILTILERPYFEDTVKTFVADLLEAGADPDQRDRLGDTPLLHLAKGKYDHPELDVLLAAGADPCIADRRGWVPYELALDGELYHTSERLAEAGGKPDPTTRVCRRAEVVAAGAEKALGLGRAERRRIQICLKAEGFDPGPADGAFGPRTRAAIRGWQSAQGGSVQTTGYLAQAHADALSGCEVAAGPEPACPGKEKGEGCWMEVSNQPGCWMWNPNPAPEETVTWTGGCTDGKASGKGKRVWRFREDGEWKTSEGEGELRGGNMNHGHWVRRFFDGEVWEGPYVDGKPHGLWVRRGSGGRDWSCWKNGERVEGDRDCVNAEDLAMQVAASGARMRSGPGEGYEALGRLVGGAKVKGDGARGRRRMAAGGSADGGEGLRFVQASKLEEVAGVSWTDGHKFRDCPECPEMVVVASGSFDMGSPSGEAGRDGDEGSVHRVRIGRSFAVGVYEVTFGEWEACVSGGGCGGYRPDDEGWGRGPRPVINVSWEDTQGYVGWLSRKTGQEYRLLSESEWEYVARAGTRTAYWWGDGIGRNRTSCNGCGSRWDALQTVPVGSFSANGFGLYDMHGNVWEWVEDCYSNGYAGAPVDGSAWESGECGRRVLRGGSWSSVPKSLRSANRNWLPTGIRYYLNGFRVARTLTP